MARDPSEQQGLVEWLREKIDDAKAFDAYNFTIRDQLEFLNAIFSIFLVTEFIMYTYAEEGEEAARIEALQYPEMIVLVYLSFDWLFFFYISENRLLYPFSFQSFVSYITIIPSFLLLTGAIPFRVDAPPWIVATENDLHLCKVLRLFSINRVEECFIRKGASLGRAIFKLLHDVVCLILLFTSWMLVAENILYIKPYC